jgi:predicted PurR-regulated permease PerM
MPAPPGTRDLPRIVIGILFILLLGSASLYILKPFLPALIWATMIVAATWPLLKVFQKHSGGSRAGAVLVMMVLLRVIVIAPLVALVSTLVEQAERLAALKAVKITLPGPPDWVAGIPLVGAKVSAEWIAIVAEGPESIAARLSPYMTGLGAWLLSQLGGLGGMVLHLLLVFLLCGILYSTGDVAARGVRRFFRRLHGDAGEQVVVLAGASIRAVALGIIVTAVAQTVLGGLGLLVTGVPYVAVLTALMLVCCIAQIGPSLVLIGGVVWLWHIEATGWAIALAVWTVLVASLDNVLRPWLIKRGADLPLLLIMVGVIGGLFAFGIVGLFVGPVVLAVAYTLLVAWVAEGDPPTKGRPGS